MNFELLLDVATSIIKCLIAACLAFIVYALHKGLTNG